MKKIINLLTLLSCFSLQNAWADIRFQEVSQSWPGTVDITSVPGHPELLLITQKSGILSWLNLLSQERGELARISVQGASEMGLLGIALHPQFSQNGRIFANYNPGSGALRTRIAEFQLLLPAAPVSSANMQGVRMTQERILMEVIQPYSNHNAGQLQFGPDGMLYISMGDGGSGGDPLGHGQNTQTLLGSILRVDVDQIPAGATYGIPSDNPFANGLAGRPEIFAWGLRNPWRMSFTPDGRLVAADVGQGALEEVNIVGLGQNMGWNTMEGSSCYARAVCNRSGLTGPILEYPRSLGYSITGGYVYQGLLAPSLHQHYVFADFGSGRFWHSDLIPQSSNGMAQMTELSNPPRMNPSTFGIGQDGEIYVADYGSGRIYRLEEI